MIDLQRTMLEARLSGMKANDIVLGLQCDKDGQPTHQAFSVPRDILKEGHIHVRGRTRSGKTSLALAPLIEQLISPYPYYGPDGELLDEEMKDPIFIFDLGGDLALFNFVKKRLCEAQVEHKNGKVGDARKFRFLSLKENDDWDYFDPFQIVQSGEKNIIRLAQVLIEAFNQDYGLMYGAAYYSMRSLSALIRVAEHVVRKSKSGTHLDFKDVGNYLQKPDRGADRDEAAIRMAFDFLMKYDQLQSPPPGAPHRRQINMQRALDDSEVVYFFCPSMGQATTARQIAGLGLYTLLAAAQLRKDQGHNKGANSRHAWVLVDEFHELAGRSFASLLAQSSKYSISLILANQTTTQLENRDINLAHVVRDNCLAKMYFTVTGKQDLEELQAFSQEDRDRIHSGSKTHHDMDFKESFTDGYSERITTKLKRDDILSTSSTGKHFYLIMDDGSGHREPQRLYSDFTIDKQDFLEYKNEPVPHRNTTTNSSIENSDSVTEEESLNQRHEVSLPTQETNTRVSLAPFKDEALITLLTQKQQQEDPTYISGFFKKSNN